jgi:DNA modification methylase
LKTSHRIHFKSATDLHELPNESVDLMVTSPPYPMIEMWDAIFSKQNSAINDALAKENGNTAFEFMHQELDKVWAEVHRVLKKGGFACINIGDATRKIGKEFKLYSNHSRILEHCLSLGFSSLPEILWRKQTNAPNKFMGSGMLPAGAYITLEHEFILVLRKGGKREFKTAEEKLKRMQSAFFWEERNIWFSDVWEDLKGTKQNNINKKIRERSGAYPFELAYRIINMFSLREDTVLDPFLGTGTTTIAAMATGRNSVGIEIDSNFKDHLQERFEEIVDFSNKLVESRLENHLRFIQERTKARGLPGYCNKVYGFPVMTRQEVELVLDELETIRVKDNVFEINYKEAHIFSLKEGKVKSISKVPLSKWIRT